MRAFTSFLLFFLFVFSSQYFNAQTGCLGADPFCTGTNYSFNNSTNVTDLGSVDCLFSTPNPTWYYMEIDQNGPMGFTVSQTSTSGAGLDVDFALWGPYSSLAAGCGNPFPSGTPIDCSYSSAASEAVNIPNAQVGQTYILLITNFSNQPGTISFAQTSGTGSADCSFTCGVNLTATPGACNNNLYSVSGNLTVTSGPGVSVPNTGTVTISNSCGGSQTFNAPFTNIPYNFTGLTANGSGCVITATFSNFPNCNTVQNYTAPAGCVTQCNISSVTASPTACSANLYNLSGQISFSNQPTSGTLTVTGSCGGTQTFNAPFTSPLNYTFSNLTANGAACSVTATFSANASCSLQQTYTAPPSCQGSSGCSFTDITGTIIDCDVSTNQYTIAGTVTFSNAPATGSLTLLNSCGGSQSFNAPFTGSVNYSFVNSADGLPCTITASFTDDNTCTATLDYDASPPCTCPADIGTYNYTVDGANVNPNNPIKLCYGEQLSVTSNNNWTPPNETIGGTDPNPPPYIPGIYWLIYSCPPTFALTPTLADLNNQNLENDPCLQGVISSSPSWGDLNNLSIINAFPAGTFTNNTIYYVPITMYDTTGGTYSYIIEPALMCYEMGAPFVVQYLPDVTFTQTQNCSNGTVTATISGGDAQVNGSNFSIVPGSISPSTAQAVNSTAANGGTITIGNLQTGPYSFDIQDANGCSITISGNFTGGQPASLTYNDDIFCLVDPNPTATIVGTQGGTFASSAGLTINATTGSVNLLTSTPGTYTITYTTPGPLCPGTDSYTITIQENPIVDAGEDVTVCYKNSVTLQASGADSYTWNNGVMNGMAYLPNLGVTEFIVIGSSTGGCIGTDTVIVTVIDDCENEDEVVFWVPNTFTPDNDQFNQSFNIVFYSGYDPFSFELTLYNRWGELIWESRNVNIGWDGTYNNGMKVPDGVYTWKVRFKRIQNDLKETFYGHVNVLR